MTEAVRVGEVVPGVLAEVVERAGHGYDRWAELVAQAGYCHHPIRLAGRVEHADQATGEVRTVYDSAREPDGVLLKACGTRRESCCPSCAATYRADAYQLLAAGLKGGKGIPESVAEHPRLFVTFTAPSFGKVHTRKAQGRLVLPCHPFRQGARCPHGNRAGCWHRHDTDDLRLGEPLCPSCYNAEAQVLWNALAPELWRRTTIAVHRGLGRLVGLQEGELRRLVRVSYAKVAEFQRRGAIHFHAVIRLDAPPTAAALAALPRHSSRSLPPSSRTPCGWRSRPSGCPARPSMGGRIGMPGGVSSSMCATSPEPSRPGSCRPSRSPGTSPSTRHCATESSAAASTDASPRTTWSIWSCGRPELDSLRLRAWAHMLGFRGHWSTKSRRYSTTFTVLRRARVAFAKRRRARDGVPLDAWDRPEDDQAVVVGAGYETEGERWLALSAAARAREERRVAREELST